MEVGAAGQDGQGLVRGVAAEIGPLIHGVQGLFEKVKVGAVGVVDEDWDCPLAAVRIDRANNAADVCEKAEVVGACQKDSKGRPRQSA